MNSKYLILLSIIALFIFLASAFLVKRAKQTDEFFEHKKALESFNTE